MGYLNQAPTCVCKYTPQNIKISIIFTISTKLSMSVSDAQKNKKYMIIATDEEFKALFEVGDVIDSGTYGYVQKGTHKQSREDVAIKNLKDFSTKDTFQNEQLLMTTIHHPNVLKSLGLFYIKEKEKLMLVSPFCHNGNLKTSIDFISKKNQLFKLDLCLQLARGLDALHQKNFMHRDIKPANILFDSSWIPKICDFGFSKQDNDFEKTTRVGTLSFKDPNISTGNYSKKCDIYSLGLVFFYIFKGSEPFRSSISSMHYDREIIIFQNQREKRIQELPNCPSDMKNILKKCLQKNEMNRIDAHKLVQELQKINYQRFGFSETPSEKSLKQDIQKITKEKNFYQAMKSPLKITRFNTEHQIGSGENNKKQESQFNNMGFSQMIRMDSEKDSSASFKYQQVTEICRLLKAKIYTEQQLKKSKNAGLIYSHFVNRKMAIKDIQVLCKCQKIPFHELKLIVFVCLFGYLCFLKRKYLFFAQKDQKSNIEGVTLEEMSELTVSQCTKLIESQNKSIKGALRPMVNELYSTKAQYGQVMSDLVKQMVNNGKERQFSNTQAFLPSEMKNELTTLVTKCERYFEEEAIKTLNNVMMIFE